MKKVLSLFLLAFLLLGVVGCNGEKKERTYVADGTYVAWELGTMSGNVLNADGTKYADEAGKNYKSTSPVLSTVSVTIANDEIIKFEIDERQSKSFMKEGRHGLALTWEFNKQTKRELKYGYGMEDLAKQGEWFQTIVNLETAWLNDEPKAVASVSITHENYVELAKEAIQMAKDGKVGYIYPGEHYTYDVAYATGKVDANGKISDVRFDAFVWGYGQTAETVLDAASSTYNFAWPEESKYEGYAKMGENSWQAMIDTLEDYIEENGFDGTLTTSGSANNHKGFHIANEPVEALASVTIQVHGEITALVGLLECFPNAWAE